MTNLEKLQSAINSLGNIRVPTMLMESVSIPLYNAIVMIDGVYQDLLKKEHQQSNEELTISDIGIGDAPPDEQVNKAE